MSINSAGKFSLLQKAAKNLSMPTSNNLYNKVNSNIHLTKNRSLMSTLENYCLMRFYSLSEKNVTIGTYQEIKSKYGYPNGNNVNAFRYAMSMV